MEFSKPVMDLIEHRHSCRTYEKRFLGAEAAGGIRTVIKQLPPGPFGGTVRTILAAASEGDTEALKGLGTYGFIRNPAAFIIGAVREEKRSMVDFGYQMQVIALHLEDMGLASCWLGGSFRKSRFAAKIACAGDETVPAVLSAGYPAARSTLRDKVIRLGAGSDRRKPRASLFFSGSFGTSLQERDAEGYAPALDAVRLAPSASNRQPWRIVFDREKRAFHFYLARTPGYAERARRGGMSDLQLADMGIALCHFEAAASAGRLSGRFQSVNPGLAGAPAGIEYIVSWTFGN
jgi:hypothetical protein